MQLQHHIFYSHPYFEKDMQQVERVQRRGTKIIADIKNCPYEERLNKRNQTTLKLRREREELIDF